MTQLVKIVRTLCKYFLPRPKKMSLSSKVRKLRDELLKNCEYAIVRLKAAEDIIEKGTNVLRDSANATYSEALTLISTPDSSQISLKTNDEPSYKKNYEYKDKIINDVYSVIHGVLIQEWEHFLYGIFAEGVVYYLRGYDLGKPTFNLKFKELKQTTEVTEIHENIASEAKESLYGYKNLLQQSCNLFKLKDFKKSDPCKEMKKHILVRHIFQHGRGKIRKRDIEKNENKPFLILNDEGKPEPYKEGKDIPLSLPEIQKLYTVIEKYSEAFQKQAENAKPITPTLSP